MFSWSGLWLLLCLLNLVDVVALVLFLVIFSCRWFAIAAVDARRTISCRMLSAS